MFHPIQNDKIHLLHPVLILAIYQDYDVLLTADGEPIGTVSAARGNEWTWQTTELAIPDGISAIYFRMKGYGTLSLAAVKFH